MNSTLVSMLARTTVVCAATLGAAYLTFHCAISGNQVPLGPPPRDGCVTITKKWQEYSGGGIRSETQITPYIGSGIPIGNGMAMETEDKPQPVYVSYYASYAFPDGKQDTQRIGEQTYARIKAGAKIQLSWEKAEARGLFSNMELWVANFTVECGKEK